MQIINHYFGGKITLGFKDTHVNKNHKIIIEDFGKEIFPNDKFLVNSFHKNIITLNYFLQRISSFFLSNLSMIFPIFFNHNSRNKNKIEYGMLQHIFLTIHEKKR